MHLNSFMCFLCVSSGCLLEVMNGNVSQLCYNVLFYMSSQRTWARACKITLTAFVIFFSSVHTQSFLKSTVQEKAVTLQCIGCISFLQCVLSNVSSS